MTEDLHPPDQPERVAVDLPYPGDSWFDDDLSHEMSRDAEYFADERQAEDGVAPGLRLDAREVVDILYEASDWSRAWPIIERDWAWCFDQWFREEVGIDLDVKVDDEGGVTVSRDAAAGLFVISMINGHKNLDERHPCVRFGAGFDELGGEDIGELILAYIEQRDIEDWQRGVDYLVCEGETMMEAYQASIDWDAFELAVEAKRWEIVEHLAEYDPDNPLVRTLTSPPPIRCQLTLDLFPETLRHAA